MRTFLIFGLTEFRTEIEHPEQVPACSQTSGISRTFDVGIEPTLFARTANREFYPFVPINANRWLEVIGTFILDIKLPKGYSLIYQLAVY